LTGFESEARWSFFTFDVIVAEKRNVFLSLGHAPTMISSSLSKSILSSLSASSKTRYLTPLTEKPFVF